MNEKNSYIREVCMKKKNPRLSGADIIARITHLSFDGDGPVEALDRTPRCNPILSGKNKPQGGES
jgi:hypothetical protein